MPRRVLSQNVFDAAVERMRALYEEGHRVIVSFSGGKDSTCCLEVCLIAARMAGALPVEVIMRDEEVMYPGTFEYCERVRQREGVVFYWIVAHQPIVNVCNRADPFYWVFDPLLPPDKHMRPMPEWAIEIPEMSIQRMVTPERFPPKEGKDLFCVLGLRVQESFVRRAAVFSSKGYLTGKSKWGYRKCRPIYDWGDGDVWKAIGEHGWDYNSAYDHLARYGLPRKDLRIAPPALTAESWRELRAASHIWPRWFDRLNDRLPGVLEVARYGVRALQPIHRAGETWEETYMRECVETAPGWIRERALRAREMALSVHETHASSSFPEITPCTKCVGLGGSWRSLALGMYNGDPFALKIKKMDEVEPEFFRPGTGKWGGSPQW